ncbi:NACHT domain-containing protein [Streptomyces sp. N50]|uniref:NACHT domain-containing protein n=1 Tax=Streptomyces sp. N50 TaxID=3081765 RepID=UPI002961F540|nr:NACHT domain-containing protein [Streptomyces sp. N50]WOX12823.1 NACHT domain-containing protein [Streptomyces sp. N50]
MNALRFGKGDGMSAEAAALRLGTTVVKAAAQTWLGGKRQEQERRLPMDDLVRRRLPGLRQQRSVQRQFEEMADTVAARIEPFLAQEFRGLDESGREAALNGVCDTFERADLSDEAILAADAQPAELIRHITASVSAPIGLNEPETRLYDILFSECCEYYVSIVRTLPVFEERTLAELLARTSSLSDRVARVLERLPDRSLFAPDGTDQDHQFRRWYMELVSNTLDEVELFRRTSDRAAAQVRLSVAYVSLRATGDDGTRRRATVRALPLRPDLSGWEESGTESSGMRVESALGGASRVLLRGEAGSGKTTLLRWLAITAARGAFTAELADWNGLTPVFVKLREYSGRSLPKKPEELLDGVAGNITGIMPRGWVERQLRDNKVLLLVDGVDELLGSERRSVRDWLRKLLGAYGGIRVVVTSRPTAAGADWLRREDFTALHLDRMTPPDLAAFVRQWHEAVRELGDELPCGVEELPRYEQSLLNSLKDRAHLQSLAGTPLLAAMLCAMHLNRGSQLPRDRMELYRNALHTLVHDRDADRNVPSAADSKLSLGDKLVVLRDLAWRLSDNNRSEIALDQAAVHVAAKLSAMRHLEVQQGGHGVLEQLRDRSGILRSPVEGRLDFVHRTFQEYLAAEEATEEDRIGNLVGRAHLDLWRETIIMAAGHANSRQRQELLDGILDRAEAEPRYARGLRLLAASCQETLPTIPDGLAGRLDGAMSALLPARRRTDAPALAAVGTSLLRRLPRSLDELTEKSARQTVRTVAMIGGEEALALMVRYAEDRRHDVVHEIVEAWAYFDADAYGEEVLAGLPLEGHLVSLTHSQQWRAATRLKSITALSVQYPLTTLTAMDQLPPMKDLSVDDLRGPGDLSVLTAHPQLRGFTVLGQGRLHGLESVENLRHLLSLGLGHGGTASLDSLRLGPMTSWLSLYELSGTSELTALSNFPNVRDLFLATPNGYTPRGLSRVSAMPGLHDLSLIDMHLTEWLTAREPLPAELETLALYSCVVPGDSGIYRDLSSLNSLRIVSCQSPEGDPITALDLPVKDLTIR